jgi:hypothetical protein
MRRKMARVCEGIDILVGATIAHHSNGLHREDHDEGLADLSAETGQD